MRKNININNNIKPRKIDNTRIYKLCMKSLINNWKKNISYNS